MMYYRISKNEKNLFFGKKIAQVWAVTLNKPMLPGRRLDINQKSVRLLTDLFNSTALAVA